MKMKTELKVISIDDIIKAEWNYKEPGDDIMIAKLVESIKEQGSIGVLPVRQIKKRGKIVYEVFDGNHRYEAALILKLKKVPVEDFGLISKAQAILYSRQRNEQWFETNQVKLSQLMNEFVLPTFRPEQIELMLPETIESLAAHLEIGNLEFQPPQPKKSSGGNQPQENMKNLSFYVNEEVFNLWQKWYKRLKELTGSESNERALEFAIIEALNAPEDQWKN